MLSTLVTWVTRHGLRAVAALALAALTFTLGCFNVHGWWVENLQLLATLAACFEVIGFVFAVLTEDAVRRGRFDRALVCFLILTGAAAFNTVGGHRAWEASMGPRQDAVRRHAQADLDKHRAELLLTSARADAEIARVPLPDPAETPQRQAEARATWSMATTAPRQRKAAAETELAGLPVVAAPPAEFPDWLVWSFLGFLEVAKALGLWAIGMNPAVAPALRVVRRQEDETAEHAEAWSASEVGRRLVGLRRDRQPA